MIMTLGTVNSKKQETTLSVWQINTVHIFSLLETLDSALRHINPLNFCDKIAGVYEYKRWQIVSNAINLEEEHVCSCFILQPACCCSFRLIDCSEEMLTRR